MTDYEAGHDTADGGTFYLILSILFQISQECIDVALAGSSAVASMLCKAC